ncbi:TetR/AcrR family transcriptional regulator C-terminal domain-containing protein [Dactylosporangium sp. NPDC000244]|uniref:TetR/AcrR family transcriptional regulator C-terminal domain-containing protein n=1 Tax=Dactylosporangium sp. NPDC000244 TaxID=3154365 RepID=UPI0033291A04
MTVAPYQRIVADIAERIADGRLRPGERLPATRRLARDHGVALATATKALAVLQQRGLVVAKPRSGTVVAGGSTLTAPGGGSTVTAPAMVPRGPMTTADIVRAAIEIADAEGLAALSMRGVAAKLGVPTMSTYRHVESKERLVALMADTAYGELEADDPGPGWRAAFEAVGRTLWALYRRHPWLAHVTPLTRPLPLPNLLRHSETFLGPLAGRGLDATARLDLQVMLLTHIQGLAVQLEAETQAQAATGLSEDDWMDEHGPALAAIAATGRYPGFAALMGDFAADGGYELDLDRIFELGLRTLLDGLAATVFADQDRA